MSSNTDKSTFSQNNVFDRSSVLELCNKMYYNFKVSLLVTVV